MKKGSLAIIAAIILTAVIIGIGLRGEPGGSTKSEGSAKSEDPTGSDDALPSARLFVSNYKDDTISVINLDLTREEQVLPMPDSPSGLALRQSPPLLAVANSTAKYITLVDPVTLEVLGKIETANSSYDLVFGADGKLLYTVGPYARVINILDVEKREIVGTIEGLDGGPIRIEISPDGETLYVLAKNAKKRIGLVVFASTSKREIEAQVTVDSTPQGLALHPNGKLLFATSFKLNTASVIDTATREIVSKWDVETGEGLSVHPTKPVLYSTGSFDGDIHVLNYETGELIEVLSLGDYPTYSDLSPDGRYLFVPHEDSSLVAQIDTETNERVARIAVGREPVEVRYFELP